MAVLYKVAGTGGKAPQPKVRAMSSWLLQCANGPPNPQLGSTLKIDLSLQLDCLIKLPTQLQAAKVQRFKGQYLDL